MIVHTYWGAPSDSLYAALLDANISGIGFDLVLASDATETLIAEHGVSDVVAAGVVDGQNTRIETVEEVNDRLRPLTSEDPDRVYLTTNTESFYLPVGPFEAKMDVLGAAAAGTEVTQ